jgi:hypothetical protein
MLVTYDEELGKVGFVDRDGACLDYTLGEGAGWFVSRQEPLFYGGCLPEYQEDIDEYDFDPAYIRDVGDFTAHETFGAYSFRLVADEKEDLYLVIYNNLSHLLRKHFQWKAAGCDTLTGEV